MLRQGVMLETTWALDTLGQERWHIRTAQTLRLIVNMPRLSTFQAISSRFAWFRKCRSGQYRYPTRRYRKYVIVSYSDCN